MNHYKRASELIDDINKVYHWDDYLHIKMDELRQIICDMVHEIEHYRIETNVFQDICIEIDDLTSGPYHSMSRDNMQNIINDVHKKVDQTDFLYDSKKAKSPIKSSSVEVHEQDLWLNPYYVSELDQLETDCERELLKWKNPYYVQQSERIVKRHLGKCNI